MKQLVACGLLAAAVVVPAIASDTLPKRVQALVNDMVIAEREESAFRALEGLGMDAVPYIVGHLDDVRPLPHKAISLENKATDAFEGVRHYGPATVHDALAAILNQVTGKSFEFVYNGATPELRQRNTSAWRQWCREQFPEFQVSCEHGI